MSAGSLNSIWNSILKMCSLSSVLTILFPFFYIVMEVSFLPDRCPALIEAMADPQNIRIVVDENSDCYIEASEFANYCEATDQDLGSAVESIVEAYDKFVPGIRCDKIHIVFPQSKIGADKLSDKKLGIETGTDSWAYKLIQGCQQFGIKANVGVTEKDVDKADDSTVSIEAN